MCALILAFIFLTPQAWFKTGEPTTTLSHQNGSKAAEKLFISSENLAEQPGTQELERRARELTGRPSVKVNGARAVKGADGRVVAYEIDIE
jgi:hypothetical protein